MPYAMLWQITKLVGDKTMSSNENITNGNDNEIKNELRLKWDMFRKKWTNMYLYASQEGIKGYLCIPNDIHSRISDLPIQGKNTGNHKAVAFMVCVLSKLSDICHENMTIREIKSACGYREDSKELDYLTKKNGVLEQAGLIETITAIDYSVLPNKKFESRKATYTSDSSGNFFRIPIMAILICMFQSELGASGLYIYSIIAKYHQLNRYRSKQIDGSSFVELTGIKKVDTIDKFISFLVESNLIVKYSGKVKTIKTGQRHTSKSGYEGYEINSYRTIQKPSEMNPTAFLSHYKSIKV